MCGVCVACAENGFSLCNARPKLKYAATHRERTLPVRYAVRLQCVTYAQRESALAVRYAVCSVRESALAVRYAVCSV